jgi:hypothetical protein
MSGDIMESLVMIGVKMRLALPGTSMAIDVNEWEINDDMKGRFASSLFHSMDTRFGRRGLH